MVMDKSERDRMLRMVLHEWDGYDPTISDRENLIEMIIELGYLDDALILLQRYRRRRFK